MGRAWKALLLFCVVLAFRGYAQCSSVSTRLLAKGTLAETLLYIYDSQLEGNTLMFVAGTHGNEDGGYRAAEQMVAGLEMQKGRILIIPHANLQAVAAYSRTTPGGEDMNRSYPGDKEGSAIQVLAAEIIALIEEFNPIAVVDMHEGRNLYGVDGSIGNSLVLGTTLNSFMVALEVLEKVNAQNGDRQPFTFDTNPPKGSLNHTASVLKGVDSFTVETPQIYDLEVRIFQHLLFVSAFMESYDIQATW